MDGGMEGETLSEILYISVRKVGDSCISAGRRRLDFGDPHLCTKPRKVSGDTS